MNRIAHILHGIGVEERTKSKARNGWYKELSMGKSDSTTNIRKHFTAIKLRLQKRNAERETAYYMRMVYGVSCFYYCFSSEMCGKVKYISVALLVMTTISMDNDSDTF